MSRSQLAAGSGGSGGGGGGGGGGAPTGPAGGSLNGTYPNPGVISRTQLTFRPGGTASGNVFTSWAALVAISAATPDPKDIYFDTAGAPGDGQCHIPSAGMPSGGWDLGTADIRFVGYPSALGAAGLVVDSGGVQLARAVTQAKNLRITNNTALAVGTISGGALCLFDACIFSSSGGPFLACTGSASLNIGLQNGSSILDGGGPVFSAGAGGIFAILSDVSVIEPNTMISDGPILFELGISSSASAAQSPTATLVFPANPSQLGVGSSDVSVVAASGVGAGVPASSVVLRGGNSDQGGGGSVLTIGGATGFGDGGSASLIVDQGLNFSGDIISVSAGTAANYTCGGSATFGAYDLVVSTIGPSGIAFQAVGEISATPGGSFTVTSANNISLSATGLCSATANQWTGTINGDIDWSTPNGHFSANVFDNSVISVSDGSLTLTGYQGASLNGTGDVNVSSAESNTGVSAFNNVNISTQVQDVTVTPFRQFLVNATSGSVFTGGMTTDSLAAGTVAKTTTYTILASDHTIRGNATGGAFTVTLPTAASVPGKFYSVKKTDASANALTLKGNGSETIDGANTQVISVQYKALTVQSNGTSWDIL